MKEEISFGALWFTEKLKRDNVQRVAPCVRIEWNAFYNFLCNSLISLHPVLHCYANRSAHTLYNFSVMQYIWSLRHNCAACVQRKERERDWVPKPRAGNRLCVCLCVNEFHILLEIAVFVPTALLSTFDESRRGLCLLAECVFEMNSWVDAGKRSVPLSRLPYIWARHNKCRWCLALIVLFPNWCERR